MKKYLNMISTKTFLLLLWMALIIQLSTAQQTKCRFKRCSAGQECHVRRMNCRQGARVCSSREICIRSPAPASNTVRNSPNRNTPPTQRPIPARSQGRVLSTGRSKGITRFQPPASSKSRVVSRITFHQDCQTMKCADGEYCRLVPNRCMSLPCPPVPACMEIVDKPGECPAVSVSRRSQNCVDQCSRDDQCTGEQKCCMDGCKKACMSPEITQRSPAKTLSFGFCPAFPDVELPDCTSDCAEDSQCLDGMKCCKYGCSMRCVRQMNTSAPEERPNSCPFTDVMPVPTGGSCSINCTVDSECPGIDKCCLTGCSMVCQPVLAIHPTTRTRPGYCPKTIPGGDCSTDCTVDSACPTEQKCCSFDCGRVCIDTVTAPAGVTKAGTCPPPSRSIARTSSCRELCRFDNTCNNTEKCCQYGCISQCRIPLPVAGQSKSRQPVQQANDTPVLAPGERSGSCPRIPPLTNQRPCKDKCSKDVDCPRQMKCCHFRCGKRCLNAGSLPQIQRSPAQCGRGGCTDTSCPSGEICINDGCNMVCKRPATSSEKAGSCPIFSENFSIRFCTNSCDSDSACQGARKCCAYGPCRRCFLPVDQIARDTRRPIQCPNMPATSNLTSCEPMCSSDASCGNNQMCCPFGCSTKCLSPQKDMPILKPGYCPRTSFSISSFTCFRACDTDGDCSGNTKCCGNGCSKRCLTPKQLHPKVVRPGSCPAATVNSPSTNCEAKCSSDFACVENEKCCYNGCRRECVPAIMGDSPQKFGFCPTDSLVAVNSFRDFRRQECGHFCKSDFSCPGELKCCKQGCKTSCVGIESSPPPITKAGYCPATITDPDTCQRTCHSDLNCEGNKKCCFQGGCTQKCLRPTPNKPVARPGMCPLVNQLPADQCRTSVDFCNSDHACPDPLKCCFDGCSNRCLNPESSLVSTREGFCPSFTSDNSSSCTVECSTDDSCAEPQKCCSVGCAVKCIDPLSFPPIDKAGFCPFIPLSLTSTCEQSCSLDNSCPGSMKCCQNGCSRKCYAPVGLPPAILKAGFCPASVENPTCQTPCNSDGTCPGEQKCCQLSCGMSCIDSVADAPNVKMGFCPFVHPNISTMCLHTCSSDHSCPGDTKCCSYGDCSMRCMGAEKFPHATTKDGDCPSSSGITGRPQRITCLSDYSCPGHKKCCRMGNAVKCEEPQRSFLSKGGICPNIINTSPVCTKRCRHDNGCSGDRKCCKSGCSTVCVAPALDDVLEKNPGFCPYVDLHVMTPCLTNCTSDGDCASDSKCCEYGCGMRCLRSQPFAPGTVKDGACPNPRVLNRLYEGASFWFQTEERPSRETYGYRNCLNDGQCPGNMKCCQSSVGGTECIAAI